MHLIPIFKRVNTFFEWVEKAFTPDYQREIEDYLAESVDLNDLEYRMRMLEKRGML